VPNAQPKAEIERIMHLAQQTRMLATDFVSGDVLMTRAVRGVAVEAVPVPVQFVYNSHEMTPLGREYAEDMLKLLREQGHPRILLVGHTDPIGSDSFNLDLSLRRADSVRHYLAERDYPRGTIEVEGRGRRDPLHVENEGQYSIEQIYQMQRRVEVKFRYFDI
jgi:outer membrane protein OmpA-like peptidoglycan-associated protein